MSWFLNIMLRLGVHIVTKSECPANSDQKQIEISRWATKATRPGRNVANFQTGDIGPLLEIWCPKCVAALAGVRRSICPIAMSWNARHLPMTTTKNATQ